MKARWLNIKGLDGDYNENNNLYFDEKHYRIYENVLIDI